MRFAPLIVTDVPTLPLAGVKPVIVGGRFATTVKFVELSAIPAIISMVIDTGKG